MKKMFEEKLEFAKQEYKIALMRCTEIERHCKAIEDDVRKYDPGALVMYPGLARELHGAKNTLREKELSYLVEEAQFAALCTPNSEAVMRCIEERNAYESALNEFMEIRENTLNAWYALENAVGEEQVANAQKEYKAWEYKLYGAPRAYEKATAKYAEAWKKAKQE